MRRVGDPSAEYKDFLETHTQMSTDASSYAETVMQHTGVDEAKAEAALARHDNNIVNAICDILGLTPVEEPVDTSPLAEVRRIVSDKEAVFHKIMQRSKAQAQAPPAPGS